MFLSCLCLSLSLLAYVHSVCRWGKISHIKGPQVFKKLNFVKNRQAYSALNSMYLQIAASLPF